MSIDSIGNFLTSIRNALMVSKRTVTVPYSKMRQNIAEILKEEGYVREVSQEGETPAEKTLTIRLKYVEGQSVINEIKRISKPGRRYYEGSKLITPVIGGMGISILTTNSGVITDKKARELGVGGEVLCHIW